MRSGRVADVIVIGAGIIGAACARELARRGQQVLVIDAGLHGATAAGMGHLLVLDDNQAELDISRYSVRRWRELGPQLPDNCAYRGNGTLWLAANGEEMAVAESKFANLRAEGVACELVPGHALQALEPILRDGLDGALRLPDDGILYAPNTARWLLDDPRIAQRRGRVVELDGKRLRLDDGQWLSADAVVLANGIQAVELCPELPIEPKKGHLLITDRYPQRVTHTITELGYVTSVHNASGPSVACNIQPRPTGQLFIGTSRQFDTDDPQVEGWLLAKMLKRAVDYAPGLAQLNGIRAWAGFRAATPDGMPLIGEHPQQPGLWLAVGHEGLGVTAAPGTADLLGALLFGEHPPLPAAAYAPGRYLGEPAHA
ncbi:NAD(P)/FAD-dependent oxidoreductase [Phytopseudomonas dryadis]|uniref:D-amino-acid oxidase n=1 Tax=Phytopseudomonas dryadis TaxID=2487520 RepID=A0A4Q9R176_9GAMM|nr:MULTISPECIES: FAD-dependent oxidoreductase [Pseudomonas]TBU92718.1 D-amino-acid oxidase [Pseudomonas dryadis]TBV00584.1 D-amino-acid oxidase [Pseudomonas dryadis]TBV14504.1 D-amino-acid oxidase [Pseudomonas sp. FRB 230]